MFVINVVLNLPLFCNYSYLSAEALAQGTRVIVEFKNRKHVAFVVASISAEQFSAYPQEKLKPLLAISPKHLAIPQEIWQLCQFAAEYYHYPLGATIFCALPVALRKVSSSARVLNPKFTAVNKLKKLSHAPIPPNLNSEQKAIVSAIENSFHSFSCHILYGITGSGKTEVFLQLIKSALAQQLQVLVLVPEINLTPQLAERFTSRFPAAQIAILTSSTSNPQRLNSWHAAQNGLCNIILGTRLSVFTPCYKLGLIIVDEEHDSSFKQNDSLRYHARDLAVFRAKHHNIPIILSSATPALETLYNYKQGKYLLHKLTKRAHQEATLPTIKLINLQVQAVNYAGVSQEALDALRHCLNHQEMALIFINRRGYAPVLTCYECSWVSTCSFCSTNMVYHHNLKQLKCHHCGYHFQVPSLCPQCKNQYLHPIGHGTQKLEEFFQKELPHARIKRVDRDTTLNKHDWEQLYKEIHGASWDILIGTQMLAKGHDFANLTVVIGINLDTALFSYDFRAAEDLFSTLTQVAGRAGRSNKPGKVILQTHYPQHPLFNYLKLHDFNGFINYALQERKQYQLPPFYYYALVKFHAPSATLLQQQLQKLHKITQALPRAPQLSIFPPLPAVMTKLQNKFRGQMLISAAQRNLLHQYLQQLTPHLSPLKNAVIDVDPLEL
jgi:primosomal protein N' (replication factor Y)